MSASPDYIEPFEGWRIWYVDADFLLRSVTFDVLWEPDESLEATCMRPRRSRRPPWRRLPAQHEAPGEHCRCGIYGAAERETALRYVPFAPPRWAIARVCGLVALWGDVVECEAGWRASHAYPSRLYVPTADTAFWHRSLDSVVSPQRLARGLAHYRIPVELVDRMPERELPQPLLF